MKVLEGKITDGPSGVKLNNQPIALESFLVPWAGYKVRIIINIEPLPRE
jgi:hypothetical protein